jgi:glycosyltransferase involved in cell wall biosynthesis
MQQPKVTVIIPTYNRAHYLSVAIASVVAQTFDDFELLVVDDGSTDNTRALLHRLHDSRLRCLWQPHRGISAAMNTGLRAARGIYIARLDSDDLWLPDMLAGQVAVLDARPEIGLVYAKAQAMDATGRPLAMTLGMPERYPGDSFRSMVRENCTCNITVVVRRACFDRIGWYDETLQTSEDWDIWLRVAQHYPFAYVDRIVARFRQHDGNVTGSRSPHFAASLEESCKVLEKVLRLPDLPPAITAMQPLAYSNIYIAAGLRWLEVRTFCRAWYAFWRAIRVGGNPLVTVTRLTWFVLVWGAFKRHAWSRRLVESLAQRRRHWRQASEHLATQQPTSLD